MARSDSCCICRAPIRLPALRGIYVTPQDTDWCNYFRTLYLSGVPQKFYMSETRYCPNACKNPGSFDQRGSSQRKPGPAPGKNTSSDSCPCRDVIGLAFEAHTYCWNTLERGFGGPVVKQNLDLLLDSFDEHELRVPVQQFVSTYYTGYKSKWVGDYKCITANGGYREKMAALLPVCDPHIPVLQKLVERSMRKDAATLAPASHGPHRMENSCQRAVFRLPLEIQLLVLESLPDILDVCSAVAAFRWVVPDSYAQNWFPCDIVHELQHIPSEKLDWTGLLRGFAHIARRYAWSLENRRRINWAVNAIRASYMELLQASTQEL